ncbi:MAG: hypothetical protein U5K79_06445 [Cyclobacteriaceae bacterium]|nr:hypothetical protein [Cyclobacteriaceae bacterium]
MAGTKLIRKKLKNRVVSTKRITAIKRIMKKPLITNVDIEQIKEEFEKKKAAAAKPAAPVKEAKVVAEAAEAPAEAPVKKAAPKAKKEKAADAE